MVDTANNCMNWDDAIENDGPAPVILPEGDYEFEVIDFQRGRYPGSTKIPPCNKATLTFQVKTDKGTVRVRTDLILFRTLEWRLSSFFRSIGQKKRGERLVMDWNSVIGSCGRAHFKPRVYMKNGTEHTTNNVEQYLDYSPEKMSARGFVELDNDEEEIPF